MIIQHHHKYTDQGYCSINDKDIIEKAYKAYHNLSFIITIFVVLNKNERKSFMLLFQNLLNKIRWLNFRTFILCKLYTDFVQIRQNAYVAIVHCYKVYFKTL